jgi:aryl-alcohol dehydrogenase-like predicted oxidoreductase
VTLLQLHNSITPRRGDEPTSITPADVLGRSGVRETFEQLRSAGLVSYLGVTGLGSRESLGQVVDEGCFDTVQLPYHMLNPSADESVPAGLPDTDYRNIIGECQSKNMGVFAIRVFAAGALVEREPSAHTHKTAFFPLALYQRDRRRAERLAKALPGRMTLKEAAVRFVLGNPRITSAIIGFGAPHELDEVVRLAEAGPLDEAVMAIIRQSRIDDSTTT